MEKKGLLMKARFSLGSKLSALCIHAFTGTECELIFLKFRLAVLKLVWRRFTSLLINSRPLEGFLGIVSGAGFSGFRKGLKSESMVIDEAAGGASICGSVRVRAFILLACF